MRLKDAAAGVKDLFMFEPAIIQEEAGWNARIPGPELDAHIRQIADSMKEIGYKGPPVTVFLDGEIVKLTDGHCRLMAVRLAISEGAEIKTIPAQAEDRYANDADRVLSMITKNGGKPLSQLEQASVFKRLVGFNWSIPDIARKAGYTAPHVTNILSLGAAPEEIAEMVRKGEVSATTAVNTIREHKGNAPAKLRDAVNKAKASGKKKATAKHLKPAKPATTHTDKTDWSIWGPKMKAVMQQIVDAPNNNERMSAITRADKFLKQIGGSK